MVYKKDTLNLSSLQFNLSCALFVEDVCQPLFKAFGITHFGCLRIFENGQILRIANNENWTQSYFQHEFYNDLDLYNMKHVPINEQRFASIIGTPQSEHCKMLHSEFNIWNFMLIYERFSTYGDFWFFGTTRDNSQIINFYINNMNVLQHFILYFKNRAEHLYDIRDSSKLISTQITPLKENIIEEIDIHNFLQKIPHAKHYLNGKHSGKFLSRREADCLLLFAQGRSMKEIGEHMGLSPRTIETHINNIKNKVDCHTKGELISIFSKVKSPYI
ncbi:MAG: LuxR family transcriptional regulator [Proteobacteria bacterium]|nr:LuxR family transcriptional regulator [Pseudomonadota bacterium]